MRAQTHTIHQSSSSPSEDSTSYSIWNLISHLTGAKAQYGNKLPASRLLCANDPNLRFEPTHFADLSSSQPKRRFLQLLTSKLLFIHLISYNYIKLKCIKILLSGANNLFSNLLK